MTTLGDARKRIGESFRWVVPVVEITYTMPTNTLDHTILLTKRAHNPGQFYEVDPCLAWVQLTSVQVQVKI